MRIGLYLVNSILGGVFFVKSLYPRVAFLLALLLSLVCW